MKKAFILLAGAIAVFALSIFSYTFYEWLFYNKDIAMTAWALTIGVFNGFFSPARLLSIFRF
ncbi:hypothetical protein CPIN18021_1096 [Campylobacter pinnipediorum subsp. caledonicus]|uniref:Uncharacterized protein n=1 Tax=Campylobacter pinnipediorum subsp. caledonicus TaxID=1874362 RepID=A0A1S6U887_9BACT|nr:hypothetical protein [Campylobacter pinnipediorum]AQW85483.1 hypothetical protein CPIN18020_0236 [Campylobacter pinnipediorum subsp. caledonicus]AQW87895.1 hypothetical protein CPIN18021_1096 [Campylobacter pinnipediorum subsp. caledonicus]